MSTGRNTLEDKEIQSGNETSKPLSTGHAFAREGLKIAIVGAGVAGTLYPLDIIKQKLHTMSGHKSAKASSGTASESKHSAVKNFRKAAVFASARTFARGYGAAVQGTMIKNGVILQKGKLLGTEKTERSAAELEREGGNESLAKPTLLQLAMVSGIIGISDTTLTQFHSNQRTWLLHEANMRAKGGSFSAPKVKSYWDYIRHSRPGYLMRANKNIVSVGGLVITPALQDKLTVVPESIRSFVAAGTTGAISGFLTNAIEKVNKNQVIKVDAQFRTPSAKATIQKLFAEHGYKALTRGFGTSILYTIVAYNAVPFWEQNAQKVIPHIERVGTSAIGLFQKAKTKALSAAPQTPAQPAAAAEKAKEAATPATPQTPSAKM